MKLDEDSFRALARSSPWRWRTLHFVHRSDYHRTETAGPVEAWVERPGRLRAVTGDGVEHLETGLPYTTSTMSVGSAGTTPSEPASVLPHESTPAYRPDGLVAERPSWGEVDYDDPMFGNYSWVAMLDPVELSHHVAVSGCREDEVAGRPAWWARVVAEAGYDPRCGGNCCELLYSEIGLLSDFGGEWDEVPQSWRGRVYPEAYDVALDVATGVVVRLHPVGGDGDAPWLENDIRADA